MEFKIIEKKKKVRGWNLSNVERVWILNIAIVSMIIQVTGALVLMGPSTPITIASLLAIVVLCYFLAANNGWWRE